MIDKLKILIPVIIALCTMIYGLVDWKYKKEELSNIQAQQIISVTSRIDKSEDKVIILEKENEVNKEVVHNIQQNINDLKVSMKELRRNEK